jgi:hypothetical protein
MADLLLHSLSEFRELLFECLNVVRPQTVVEVGAEEGAFTRDLVDWAKKDDATVVAIDPAPAVAFVEEAGSYPDILRIVQQTSLEALPELRSAQAFFLDGDHNYGTVLAELEIIAPKDRQEPCFVVLHDVGWPSGRRDQYYSPDSLPVDWLHDHTYEEGVVVGNSGTVPGGFKGAGQFAVAKVEGGPRNGVLTAVEDFLEGRDDLRYAQVPCIFGLGLLWSADAPWSEDLARLVSPYDANPLIDRLERNRLDLYLTVLDLQQNAVEFFDREKAYLADLRQAGVDHTAAGHRIRDLEAENRAVWRRVHELEEQLEARTRRHEALEARTRETADLLDELFRTRAFRTVELLSRLRAVVGGTEPISGSRLQQAVRDLTAE